MVPTSCGEGRVPTQEILFELSDATLMRAAEAAERGHAGMSAGLGLDPGPHPSYRGEQHAAAAAGAVPVAAAAAEAGGGNVDAVGPILVRPLTAADEAAADVWGNCGGPLAMG